MSDPNDIETWKRMYVSMKNDRDEARAELQKLRERMSQDEKCGNCGHEGSHICGPDGLITELKVKPEPTAQSNQVGPETVVGSVYGHGYMRISHPFKFSDLYPEYQSLISEAQGLREALEKIADSASDSGNDNPDFISIDIAQEALSKLNSGKVDP